MKGNGSLLANVGVAVMMLVLWIWLMSRGLPFERSYLKLSLILSAALAIGFYTALAAVLNWDWFFEDGQGRWLVKRLGRIGARIFYFLLGAGLAYVGHVGSKVLVLMGLLERAGQ